MPGQPSRQLRAQVVQRVGNQCARQVHAATAICGVSASRELAAVLKVGSTDQPCEPGSAPCGIVLQRLGIGGGQFVITVMEVECMIASIQAS